MYFSLRAKAALWREPAEDRLTIAADAVQMAVLDNADDVLLKHVQAAVYLYELRVGLM